MSSPIPFPKAKITWVVLDFLKSFAQLLQFIPFGRTCQCKVLLSRNSANGGIKGYKWRSRSRGEAADGCKRVKGWAERIFAVLFFAVGRWKIRGKATLLLSPVEEALEKVEFKGGDPE